MTEQTMKCGDLFAGAGGLSAGFHEAGFRSLFFSEWDEDAAATYRLNFPDAVPFVGDIRALTAEAVLAACPEAAGLDVLAGGPPCQGFSINAPVRDAGDPRNHLFREYVRLLEGLRMMLFAVTAAMARTCSDH
jgi:DNA (cytosine-5)-methyltransferase 1